MGSAWRRHVSLVAIIGNLATAGVGLAAEHLAPADPASGHEIAQQLCSSCHLVDRAQRGPVPDGVPSFMSIARRLDDATIEALLLAASHPVMPDPPLTAPERRDVVAHIRSLAAE